MNYNNGATGAMGQTTCPDWWRLADVADLWHVPLNTLHRLVAEKCVETTTIGGEEFIPYLRVQRGAGTDVVRVIQRWKREAKGAAPVQPLSIHTFKPLGYVCQKTGLAESVIRKLIDLGEVEGMICPLTGAQHVVWSSFDAWWRNVANQRRARNMSANDVAKLSADKIKADAVRAAEEEKRKTMLDDARAGETARVMAGVKAAEKSHAEQIRRTRLK